jgi:aspartyl-tRNA(Asn)/glutamyl-tRNA(Gln) amidotransferase subunit A
MGPHQPLTIAEARALQEKGGPAAAAAACLERIRGLNPELMAFTTVMDAPDTQGAAWQPGAAQPGGPLSGIPIAVKDIIDVAGVPTTVGSPYYRGNVPARDAAAVEKLKAAGAFIIGKTNTHEIALGATGINPHYGTPRNPWDPARIPGGSSSGSAVAVASGMAAAALGSDTGGSIRVPAALCGVVGLKPTLGRVSTRGAFPLSWNLDTVGPLAACVRDAALLLQVISGYDPQDPASVDMPAEDFLAALEAGVDGLVAGVGAGQCLDAADPEILLAVRKAAAVLESLGCSLREVSLDWMPEAASANRLMTQSDGAAVHRERLSRDPGSFGEDVRRRLEAGARTSSTEYALARRAQAEVRRRCERIFSSCAILLLPSTPVPAPLREGCSAIGSAGQLTPFTAPFNLCGLPAMSVPCGLTRGGLPMGLQIVSRAGAEAVVLRAGRAFERATAAGTRLPSRPRSRKPPRPAS